jgi:opacity protein-like surface antigen
MKTLTLAVMGAALVLSAQVLAQDSGEPTAALSSDSKSGARLTVQYGFDGRDNLTGGQFRIHYDKRLMSVADLSDCLSGLPQSHRGAFSVCNDVPKKGFVQFVVFDLGRNTPIGNETLGSVTFSVNRRGLLKESAVTVEDIRLAGPDGGHLALGAEAEGGVVLDILR